MGFCGFKGQVYLSLCIMVLLLPQALFAGVGSNEDVEASVRSYFAAAPIMIEIARCESKFRQYDSTGALYGGYGNKMVGIFQIYEDIHGDYARGLGMDITTLDGNLAYAKHLYEREGTQPWISSSSCWGSAANTSNGDLRLGSQGPAVKELQEQLNRAGFTVSLDGPGSPGNETEMFGSLTRAALRKFQCAQNIACSGDEFSTGYGLAGEKTRSALAGATPAPIAQNTETTSTPATTSTDTYSAEQQAEIARLQAQIAELTKMIAELLKARAS